MSKRRLIEKKRIVFPQLLSNEKVGWAHVRLKIFNWDGLGRYTIHNNEDKIAIFNTYTIYKWMSNTHGLKFLEPSRVFYVLAIRSQTGWSLDFLDSREEVGWKSQIGVKIYNTNDFPKHFPKLGPKDLAKKSFWGFRFLLHYIPKIFSFATKMIQCKGWLYHHNLFLRDGGVSIKAWRLESEPLYYNEIGGIRKKGRSKNKDTGVRSFKASMYLNQRVRRFYGFMSRTGKNLVQTVDRKKGILSNGSNVLFEGKVDIILFRIKWTPNISEAKLIFNSKILFLNDFLVRKSKILLKRSDYLHFGSEHSVNVSLVPEVVKRWKGNELFNSPQVVELFERSWDSFLSTKFVLLSIPLTLLIKTLKSKFSIEDIKNNLASPEPIEKGLDFYFGTLLEFNPFSLHSLSHCDKYRVFRPKAKNKGYTFVLWFAGKTLNLKMGPIINVSERLSKISKFESLPVLSGLNGPSFFGEVENLLGLSSQHFCGLFCSTLERMEFPINLSTVWKRLTQKDRINFKYWTLNRVSKSGSKDLLLNEFLHDLISAKNPHLINASESIFISKYLNTKLWRLYLSNVEREVGSSRSNILQEKVGMLSSNDYIFIKAERKIRKTFLSNFEISILFSTIREYYLIINSNNKELEFLNNNYINTRDTGIKNCLKSISSRFVNEKEKLIITEMRYLLGSIFVAGKRIIKFVRYIGSRSLDESLMTISLRRKISNVLMDYKTLLLKIVGHLDFILTKLKKNQPEIQMVLKTVLFKLLDSKNLSKYCSYDGYSDKEVPYWYKYNKIEKGLYTHNDPFEEIFSGLKTHFNESLPLSLNKKTFMPGEIWLPYPGYAEVDYNNMICTMIDTPYHLSWEPRKSKYLSVPRGDSRWLYHLVYNLSGKVISVPKGMKFTSFNEVDPRFLKLLKVWSLLPSKIQETYKEKRLMFLSLMSDSNIKHSEGLTDYWMSELSFNPYIHVRIEEDIPPRMLNYSKISIDWLNFDFTKDVKFLSVITNPYDMDPSLAEEIKEDGIQHKRKVHNKLKDYFIENNLFTRKRRYSNEVWYYKKNI